MSDGVSTFPIIMFLSSTSKLVVSMVVVVPLIIRSDETVKLPVIVAPAEVVSNLAELS